MTANAGSNLSSGPAERRARRIPRPIRIGGILLPVALLLFSCSGCSPIYLAKAGWAQMKILTGRQPFDEILADPGTDQDTRRKILLTRQARAFAMHQLGLNAGNSYTSFTQLESDTLAWVLSAAYQDRLESKTWWFPIVGRVPYKGYASEKSARKAQEKLDRDGFDTYLRTTSAFSTLGWFADPLLSSLLRYDDVDLVETILHELSHNHLFVPGRVRFNESFATFVGRVGAIRFFCGPIDAPQETEACRLARDRWKAYQDFSRFLDLFIEELTDVYTAANLTVSQKVQRREELFAAYQERYLDSEAPPANALIRGFLGRPLNNATLLSRMRYFHRLPHFQSLLDEHDGDLAAAVHALTASARDVDDPFDLLPDDR